MEWWGIVGVSPSLSIPWCPLLQYMWYFSHLCEECRITSRWWSCSLGELCTTTFPAQVCFLLWYWLTRRRRGVFHRGWKWALYSCCPDFRENMHVLPRNMHVCSPPLLFCTVSNAPEVSDSQVKKASWCENCLSTSWCNKQGLKSAWGKLKATRINSCGYATRNLVA